MPRYRLSTSAQADIFAILTRSHERFGEQARRRYETLIVAALRDVAEHPDRPGSIGRPELGAGARSWHLGLSRDRARTPTGVAKHPRHILIYRVESDEFVAIARVFHDAMELAPNMDEVNWV